MKIISIGPAHPYRGGIAKFNESFVLACQAMKYDTEIISYKYLYPSFLFPGKTQFTEGEINKSLIIHNLVHSINPMEWRMVISSIARLHPDLIVIHYWMPFFAPALGIIARKVRRKTGVKIIAITHNLIPHEKHFGWKALTRFFLKSVDGIIALSSTVIKDFEEFHLPGKAICLPHPIYNIYGDKVTREEAFDHLGLDPGKTYLLFFGIIRKYKGLDLLLKAFAMLDRKDLNLIVAGEFYADRQAYFNLAGDLGITDQIVFTERYIPDEEVKYYFSAAETVVQPYNSATQSGVTQIAYHFECPMVVTDVGGLAEIVIHEKTGYVCKKDPGEIAEAITKTLNPGIHSKMVESIRKEKQRFSWQSFVENVVKLKSEL